MRTINVIAFFSLLLLISCSDSPKPEKYGLYYLNNGNLEEIDNNVYSINKDDNITLILYSNEIKPNDIYLIPLVYNPSIRDFNINSVQEFDIYPQAEQNLFKLIPKSSFSSTNVDYFSVYIGDEKNTSKIKYEQLKGVYFYSDNDETKTLIKKMELEFLLGLRKQAFKSAWEILVNSNETYIIGKVSCYMGLNKYITLPLQNKKWDEIIQNSYYVYDFIFTNSGNKILEKDWGYLIDIFNNEVDFSLNKMLNQGDQRARLEISTEIDNSNNRKKENYVLSNGIIWRKNPGINDEQITSSFGHVRSFDISPDNKKMIYTDDNRTIKIIDLEKLVTKDSLLTLLDKYQK